MKALKTKNGYDVFVILSLLQKAIRRGDVKLAGFSALELIDYHKMLLSRLRVICAEDCYGVILTEVEKLLDLFEKTKKRIFISKAVILLCLARKSRDADNMQYWYDNLQTIDKQFFNALQKEIEEIEEDKKIEIPEYVYDCHTAIGKKKGRTKKEFMENEQKELYNKEKGLFDFLFEK